MSDLEDVAIRMKAWVENYGDTVMPIFRDDVKVLVESALAATVVVPVEALASADALAELELGLYQSGSADDGLIRHGIILARYVKHLATKGGGRNE